MEEFDEETAEYIQENYEVYPYEYFEDTFLFDEENFNIFW